MASSTPARDANLLAALTLGLHDRIRAAEEKAAGHGSAAPSALVALSQWLDGGSVDDLHHVVGLTPSGTVRLIDKLEGAGLVERRPGLDQRRRSVVLTSRGRKVAQKVLAARHATTLEILEPLAGRADQPLTGVLEALLDQLVSVRIQERSEGRPPAGGWLCRLCDFDACERAAGRCPVMAQRPDPSASR